MSSKPPFPKPPVDPDRLPSRLVPQADDARRVIQLVELIAAGAEERFMEGRPGTKKARKRDLNYYRQAATILGFLGERRALTSAARSLVALPSLDDRLTRFVVALECSPVGKAFARFCGVESVRFVDGEKAEDFLEARTSCSPKLVERRSSTIESWSKVAHTHHPEARRRAIPASSTRDLHAARRSVMARKESGEVITSYAALSNDMRVATAYFSIHGYEHLVGRAHGARVSLLLGTEEAVTPLLDAVEYLRRSIESGVPTEHKRDAVRALGRELLVGSVRVKRLKARLHARLHAKLYIFDAQAAYVTSANLTQGGFFSNVESGQVVVDKAEVEHFIERFDDLFSRSDDILVQLLEAVESTWAFHELASPYLLYLRVLFELFGDVPALPGVRIVLADYQRMIVGSVLHMLRESIAGVLVAPTGTGKTVMASYTAAALFPRFVHRIFVICPNKSLGRQWKEMFRNFLLPCEVITIGVVRQAATSDGTSENQRMLQDVMGSARATDLFIVDEAHAFKNPKSSGYKTLFTLLQGSPDRGQPRRLLVTATPLGRGIKDLNTLLALVDGDKLKTLPELERNPRIVNVSRPFIEQYFGRRRQEGGAPLLDFGSEKRSFAVVRLRKIEYASTLDPLLVGIQSLEVVFHRPEETAKQQWLTALGEEFQPRLGRDLGPLLRMILMRRAESSPDALRRSLSNLEQAEALRAPTLKQQIEDILRLVPQPADDTKLQHLRSILDGAPATEKVLIFTAYVDTAEYLFRNLQEYHPSRRSGLITGRTPGVQRQRILERFAPAAQGLPTRRRRRDAIDLLIATDAIAEGENLQDASTVINYDLHWTPLPLIQRVGRVDRPTRQARTVSVLNFYPGNSLFETLMNMWSTLDERSQLYGVLANTRVLDEDSMAGEAADEPQVGIVRGIYDEATWEQLLKDYLPTSEHLVHFAAATAREISAAKQLPKNFRSAKRANRSGAFVLVKHEGRLECITDAVLDSGVLVASPAEAAHEALLPAIACERGEPSLPESASGYAQIMAVLARWAASRGADLSETEVICSEVLVCDEDRRDGSK